MCVIVKKVNIVTCLLYPLNWQPVVRAWCHGTEWTIIMKGMLKPVEAYIGPMIDRIQSYIYFSLWLHLMQLYHIQLWHDILVEYNSIACLAKHQLKVQMYIQWAGQSKLKMTTYSLRCSNCFLTILLMKIPMRLSTGQNSKWIYVYIIDVSILRTALVLFHMFLES